MATVNDRNHMFIWLSQTAFVQKTFFSEWMSPVPFNFPDDVSIKMVTTGCPMGIEENLCAASTAVGALLCAHGAPAFIIAGESFSTLS